MVCLSGTAKLKGFVEIIKLHAHRAIYVAIDLDAHERIHRSGPTRDAYFLGFYAILCGIGWDLLDHEIGSVIEVVFDENAIFGPRVSSWYPAVKEVLAKSGNQDQVQVASVLPPTLFFRSDEESVPLQAADVLAWLIRAAWSGQRNRFEWIATELMPHIPMSTYSRVFSDERMQQQYGMSERVKFSAELLAKWRELGLRGSRGKRRTPQS